MKIGVTGTREGMNQYQLDQINQFLIENYSIGSELHHGDCVGVDAEIAVLAKQIGYRIIAHPGPGGKLRALVESDATMKSQDYLARNRTIVDSCDILLVVPLQLTHQTRGGTWYTHDYGMKKD